MCFTAAASSESIATNITQPTDVHQVHVKLAIITLPGPIRNIQQKINKLGFSPLDKFSLTISVID